MSKTRRAPGDGGGAPPRPVKKKKRRRWLLYTFLFLFGIMLGGAAMVGSFVYKAYQTLPAYEEFDPSLTSKILDHEGNLLYELVADENRTLVKLDDIPLDIQNALIATEDVRFYEHFGVDPVRVAGAVLANVKYLLGREGSQLEGASTITMQLTRNSFLTLDQNMMRKVQEALIAIDLEKRFTKKEILEKYFNEVSFGYQAYGIEAAAQTYFSKSAKDLTLSEGAMLVGILKAPSQWNPIEDYESAIRRRNVVVEQMLKYDYLTPQRAAEVKADRPEVKRSEVTSTSIKFTGDWYVDHVIRALTTPALAERYGLPAFEADDLYSKGLTIQTHFRKEYQKIAEETIWEVMPERTEFYGADEVPEASVVTMNHQSGEVYAIVGGMNHDGMLTLNRATQSYRQPGSAIKPIVSYYPAIEYLGYGPGTVIDDSPVQVVDENAWPKNYDPGYKGLMSMRYGLAQSINTVAVRLTKAVGPARSIEVAHKLGLNSITEPDDANLSLALGGLTQGVTLMDLTAAYGVLGSLGQKTDPVFVDKITNRHGEVIFQALPNKQQVLNKDAAWLAVDLMKGPLSQGTAFHESKGFNGWPAAGKTGTTEYWHDAWFVGFTNEIVTGVWTGYDNEEELKELPHGTYNGSWTGAGPPTRIWTRIMNQIITEKPPDWERPSNIVRVDICKSTGLQPSPLCPAGDVGDEWFLRGKEPRMDDLWQNVQVVKQSWVNPRDGKPMDRYFKWQQGCGTPETKLMLKRPYEFAKQPNDPWNFARYWPADWQRDAPTELCDPSKSQQPPTTPPVGTNPPGDSKPPDDKPPDWLFPPGDDDKPPVDENPPPGGGTPPPGGGTPPPGTDPKPPDSGPIPPVILPPGG